MEPRDRGVGTPYSDLTKIATKDLTGCLWLARVCEMSPFLQLNMATQIFFLIFFPPPPFF